MQRPVPLTTKVFTGRWPAAATRLEVARLEATRAIGGLTEDTRFNVITYSDGIKTAFEHLALADRKTVAAAIKFVGRQTPLRNYNFAAALIAALGANTSALGKPGNDVDEVFIVYNQLQQAGPVKDPDDILRFAHELARSSKVRINTVFLGSVDDEVDPRELGLRTMRELASITGGRFVRP
jgi:hypothetical protein